jgi:hypothetical protein
MYFFLKATRTSSSSWLLYSLAGLLFGLTYLTNPVVLFVPLLLLFLHVFNRRKTTSTGKLLKVLAPFLMVFMLLVVVWQVRDMVSVSDEKESTADRAFVNLVIGSHSDYHAIWRENILEHQHTTKLVNLADQDFEQYRNDHAGFYRELLHRVWADPQHYLYWYLIQKPLDFFGWNILAGDGDIYQYSVNSSIYHTSPLALISLVIMKQLHLWLVGAALFGLCFAVREQESARKEALVCIYLCLFYITTLYVVLHTDGRYSIPLRPEIYLCAVYAIEKFFNLAKDLKAKSHLRH